MIFQNFIFEIGQFGFMCSIVYFLYVIINFTLKAYGRFALKKDTVLLFTSNEKIALLISIAWILTYLI